MKKNNVVFIIITVLISLILVNCSREKIKVIVYTMDYCASCEIEKNELEEIFENELNDSYVVTYYNVDEHDNYDNYLKLLSLIDTEKNIKDYFPVTYIEGMFVVIGYNYNDGYEMVRDIKRFENSEILGKKLEYRRYFLLEGGRR